MPRWVWLYRRNGIARLYREAPLNGIWEGSGNVICLDVHRALQREEAALPSVLEELEQAKGGNPHLDRATKALRDELSDPTDFEVRARSITEQMAVTLQAALLVRHAPTAVSDAFCASRLGDRWSGAYGTLPRGCDLVAILSRVEPALAFLSCHTLKSGVGCWSEAERVFGCRRSKNYPAPLEGVVCSVK